MDLSSLLSSLSDEDVQRLQETAASVFAKSADREPPDKTSSVNNSLISPGSEMLAAATKMSELFSSRDERSELIYALKPFLGEKRRQKADQAAMMLKMLKIVDSVRRQDK